MKKLFDNHIIMSGFYKSISGMSLFLSIRLLVEYLGSEGYGIWVLVFTLFQMVLLMDFGIQSTLKTKIPILLHKNKHSDIGTYIGVTYNISAVLAVFIFMLCLGMVHWVNLKTLFNISELAEVQVNLLFLLNIFFFCSSSVVNVHKSLFVAFLRGKYSEQSIAVNQIVFFVGLAVITGFDLGGNNFNKLLIVTFLNGFSTLFVNLIYTIYFFVSQKIKPLFFSRENGILLKEILKLGVKFMLIQVGFYFIFSADSYIISNVFSPKEIVAYEVVNKLFLFPYMVLFAAFSPLWSLFAKHYLEQNKTKLLADFKKFNLLFSGILLGLSVLYLITPFLIKIWLKEQIEIPPYLILLTAILTALKIFVSFYTFFLNGIGRLNFYLAVLLVSIVLKVPLSYYFVSIGAGINSVLYSSLIIILAWTLLIPIKSYKIANRIKEL